MTLLLRLWKNILCPECSKIISSEIGVIMNQTHVVLFLCSDCSQSLMQLPHMIIEINNMWQELEQIKNKLKTNGNSPSYAEFVSETRNLKDKISNLNEKIENKKCITCEVPLSSVSIEPIIWEMQEGEKEQWMCRFLVFKKPTQTTKMKLLSRILIVL